MKTFTSATVGVAVLGGSLLYGAPPVSASSPSFTDDQIAVATDVYDVGSSLDASDRAMLAAFEAGLVESEMDANPAECEQDFDSAGAFQQRRDWVPDDEAPDDDGWCVEGEDPRLDPEWAAGAFFNGSNGHYGALYYDELGEDYNGDPIETAGDLAQAVQVSGYPERYDEREADAEALLAIVTGDESQPYTAEEVCGDGFVQIDEADLNGDGTVVLLWNSSKGKNCAVTLKAVQIGEASEVSAFVRPEGKHKVKDSGSFQYYAGPVKAKAPGCVRWGGSVGSEKYKSPYEHCS